jgi:hypothetical protein
MPYTYPHPLTQDLQLAATPLNGAARLDWQVTSAFTLPISTTWQIAYAQEGAEPVVAISGLVSSTLAYTLTGLNANVPYQIALSGMIEVPWGDPIALVNATAIVTPTGLALYGHPGDATIYLNWEISPSPPPTTTWTISYEGTPGTEPSPISGITETLRTYALTGLTNYEWYTVTLTTVGITPILSDTVHVMPTDMLVYLPFIQK